MLARLRWALGRSFRRYKQLFCQEILDQGEARIPPYKDPFRPDIHESAERLIRALFPIPCLRELVLHLVGWTSPSNLLYSSGVELP